MKIRRSTESWRIRFQLIVAIGVVVSGIAAPVAVILRPVADPIGSVRLEPPGPALGYGGLPDEYAAAEGCGDVFLYLHLPDAAFVGEPFTVEVEARSEETCDLQATIEAVGNGEADVIPVGMSPLSDTHDVIRSGPRVLSRHGLQWTLTTSATGTYVMRVTVLTGDGEPVVSFQDDMEIQPSRRRYEGTRHLSAILDSIVVDVSTSDGRALQVGRAGTLVILLTTGYPPSVSDGLENFALLHGCVEVSEGEKSETTCWESSVNLTEPIVVERHISVRPESQEALIAIVEARLTGVVDGVHVGPVSQTYTGHPGRASISVSERIDRFWQELPKWLAVAGGVALVAGWLSRLRVRVLGWVLKFANRLRAAARKAWSVVAHGIRVPAGLLSRARAAPANRFANSAKRRT